MGIDYQGVYGQEVLKKEKYDVDLVLCIDGTGSMTPFIDTVREQAGNLPRDIITRAKKEKMDIDNLNVRGIIFRDCGCDGEYCMQSMPGLVPLWQNGEENAENIAGFRGFLDSIVADGGGDEPENGLEAIAMAMRTNWTPERHGVKRRQIISVWSDATTHPLGHGFDQYDLGLPKDFNELTREWGDQDAASTGQTGLMSYRSKRLVIYAAEKYEDGKTNWEDLANWDNVILVLGKQRLGEGLKEVDYNEIIKLLLHTIT